MKEQHLRRTNKLLFSLYLLITVFGVIGLLSQFAMSDLAPWQSIAGNDCWICCGSVYFHSQENYGIF